MKTIMNKSVKTLLTLYFTEKEAEFIVNKLNSIHRRYDFIYEEKDGAFLVYCINNTGDEIDVVKELLVYLLDRMVYGLD